MKQLTIDNLNRLYSLRASTITKQPSSNSRFTAKALLNDSSLPLRQV